MRFAIAILLIIQIHSQEITDLGVITDRRGIILSACTNRTDFARFQVELQALRFPSNSVTFSTTNAMLTLDDLVAMPPGLALLGLRSICSDGDESPVSLFRLDVRRDPPKAPKAHVVSLLKQSPAESLSNAVRVIRQRKALTDPPPPPGQTNVPVRSASPLPNDQGSTSYSEAMEEMHRFWVEHQRRRRNQ